MLTMSEPAAELVPDLPLSADALACVLEQVRDGSVLASAEAVNREWQATSAGVWPKVLAASFSLRRISDPRRRFAEEACWARGRAVRATLEAQPGIGGVCVSSGHVTCASLGSTPALSRLPLPAEVSLAPHEPRASRKFSATARLPAVACAAHDEGAAWCFEGNRMDLAFWSTTEATAGSVLRLETSPRGEVGPAPVTTVTALHACPLPGRDGRVQIVSGHAGGNVCLRVAKHSDATEAGTEGGVEVAVRAEGETGEACQAHAYPTASYSTAYGACTAVGCDATSLDGPVVVGWASGHVEAIDRERCQVCGRLAPRDARALAYLPNTRVSTAERAPRRALVACRRSPRRSRRVRARLFASPPTSTPGSSPSRAATTCAARDMGTVSSSLIYGECHVDGPRMALGWPPSLR